MATEPAPPAAPARCHDTADVVAALARARTEHRPAALDLSPMRGVTVDAEARIAWVQAGARWGDVARATERHGLAVPGGVVSFAPGGLLDNLVGAEVVTADGRVLRATAGEHADFFAVVRAGGSVTSWAVTARAYRLCPAERAVLKLNVMYAIEDADAVMRGWRALAVQAPAELTVEYGVWTIPHASELPEELRGRPTALIAGTWDGPVQDGYDAIRPYRTLAQPVLDLTGPGDDRLARVRAVCDPVDLRRVRRGAPSPF